MPTAQQRPPPPWRARRGTGKRELGSKVKGTSEGVQVQGDGGVSAVEVPTAHTHTAMTGVKAALPDEADRPPFTGSPRPHSNQYRINFTLDEGVRCRATPPLSPQCCDGIEG